jgi:hypothetical protein
MWVWILDFGDLDGKGVVFFLKGGWLWQISSDFLADLREGPRG